MKGFISIVILVAVLFSCKKDKVEQNNNQSDPPYYPGGSYIVQGFVFDSQSGLGVANVKVESFDGIQYGPVLTDQSGFYSLQIGWYSASGDMFAGSYNPDPLRLFAYDSLGFDYLELGPSNSGDTINVDFTKTPSGFSNGGSFYIKGQLTNSSTQSAMDGIILSVHGWSLTDTTDSNGNFIVEANYTGLSHVPYEDSVRMNGVDWVANIMIIRHWINISGVQEGDTLYENIVYTP